jgi:hypothetical protein
MKRLGKALAQKVWTVFDAVTRDPKYANELTA